MQATGFKQQITKTVIFNGNERSQTKEMVLILNHELGKGQYGTVYLGYDKRDPSKTFAVKALDRKKYSTPKLQQQFKNEVALMTAINSDYVISLKDVQKTASSYYLALEICNGGDLAGLRALRGGYVPEIEARVIMQQLVRGLGALAEHKIVHRDLKLENILLNFNNFENYHAAIAKGGQSQFNVNEALKKMTTEDMIGKSQWDCPMTIKIADLGLSRAVGAGEFAKTIVGTPLVMAPQVIEGKAYDYKADVWSLGCVFYQLLTGFSPFTGTDVMSLKQNLKDGNWALPKTIKLSLEGLDFLNSCLQYETDKRISLEALLYSPYMQEDPREQKGPSSIDVSFIGGENAHDVVVKNPYAWMKNNTDKIVSLNSQTPEEYAKYCEQLYAKMEQQRPALQNERVNQILGEEMGDKAGGEESRIDFMNAMNNLKKTVVEEGKWACVACTFQNDQALDKCTLCETPKPAVEERKMEEEEIMATQLREQELAEIQRKREAAIAEGLRKAAEAKKAAEAEKQRLWEEEAALAAAKMNAERIAEEERAAQLATKTEQERQAAIEADQKRVADEQAAAATKAAALKKEEEQKQQRVKKEQEAAAAENARQERLAAQKLEAAQKALDELAAQKQMAAQQLEAEQAASKQKAHILQAELEAAKKKAAEEKALADKDNQQKLDTQAQAAADQIAELAAKLKAMELDNEEKRKEAERTALAKLEEAEKVAQQKLVDAEAMLLQEYDLGESVMLPQGNDWIVQNFETKLSTLNVADLDIRKNYF